MRSKSLLTIGSILIATVFCIATPSKAVCMFCDEELVVSFFNCITEIIINSPDFGNIPQYTMEDLKKGMVSASKAMGDNTPAMRDNVMKGALSSGIAEMLYYWYEDPDNLIIPMKQIIVSCYPVQDEAFLHNCDKLMKTSLDEIKEEGKSTAEQPKNQLEKTYSNRKNLQFQDTSTVQEQATYLNTDTYQKRNNYYQAQPNLPSQPTKIYSQQYSLGNVQIPHHSISNIGNSQQYSSYFIGNQDLNGQYSKDDYYLSNRNGNTVSVDGNNLPRVNNYKIQPVQTSNKPQMQKPLFDTKQQNGNGAASASDSAAASASASASSSAAASASASAAAVSDNSGSIGVNSATDSNAKTAKNEDALKFFITFYSAILEDRFKSVFHEMTTEDQALAIMNHILPEALRECKYSETVIQEMPKATHSLIKQLPKGSSTVKYAREITKMITFILHLKKCITNDPVAQAKYLAEGMLNSLKKIEQLSTLQDNPSSSIANQQNLPTISVKSLNGNNVNSYPTYENYNPNNVNYNLNYPNNPNYNLNYPNNPNYNRIYPNNPNYNRNYPNNPNYNLNNQNYFPQSGIQNQQKTPDIKYDEFQLIKDNLKEYDAKSKKDYQSYINANNNVGDEVSYNGYNAGDADATKSGAAGPNSISPAISNTDNTGSSSVAVAGSSATASGNSAATNNDGSKTGYGGTNAGTDSSRINGSNSATIINNNDCDNGDCDKTDDDNCDGDDEDCDDECDDDDDGDCSDECDDDDDNCGDADNNDKSNISVPNQLLITKPTYPVDRQNSSPLDAGKKNSNAAPLTSETPKDIVFPQEPNKQVNYDTSALQLEKISDKKNSSFNENIQAIKATTSKDLIENIKKLILRCMESNKFDDRKFAIGLAKIFSEMKNKFKNAKDAKVTKETLFITTIVSFISIITEMNMKIKKGNSQQITVQPKPNIPEHNKKLSYETEQTNVNSKSVTLNQAKYKSAVDNMNLEKNYVYPMKNLMIQNSPKPQEKPISMNRPSQQAISNGPQNAAQIKNGNSYIGEQIQLSKINNNGNHAQNKPPITGHVNPDQGNRNSNKIYNNFISVPSYPSRTPNPINSAISKQAEVNNLNGMQTLNSWSNLQQSSTIQNLEQRQNRGNQVQVNNMDYQSLMQTANKGMWPSPQQDNMNTPNAMQTGNQGFRATENGGNWGANFAPNGFQGNSEFHQQNAVNAQNFMETGKKGLGFSSLGIQGKPNQAGNVQQNSHLPNNQQNSAFSGSSQINAKNRATSL